MSPPRPMPATRVNRAALPLAGAAALALWLASGGGAMGQSGAQPADPERPAPLSAEPDHGAVLNDRSGDPRRRKAAAAALLRSGDPAAIGALLRALGDDSGSGVREAALGAVAESWSPPARLFRSIVGLLSGPGPVDPAAVMPAIGAYRTREAAGVLVSALSSKSLAGARAAAAAALQAMSGRDDLGADHGAWSGWLLGYRRASEAEWREALAEGVWRRSARLEAERRATSGKLVAGYRQLYLALPAEPGAERLRLLARMIAEPLPDLRDLGLDIVSRELSAGKSLDGAVGDAVLALLRDASPAVRERAAGLVMQLAPRGVPEHLAGALQSETDGAAAAALMRGAARWPKAEDVEPALAWLERSPQAAEDACGLLLACADRGLLAPEPGARAAGTLRRWDTRTLPPDGCRLLALVGDDRDRSMVAGLLGSGTEAQRIAAADALASDPAYTSPVLAAASTDPALFEFAVRAVVVAGPDAAAWDALAAIPAPDAGARNTGLVSVAIRMPLKELVAAAERHESEPEVCELLLAGLAEMGVDPVPTREPADPALVVEGIVRLARARLAARRPDMALAALETLPAAPAGEAERPEIASLRTVALLWANQIERADAENAPASAWLDGLEAAASEPHAPAILQRLRARFATLSPEESERLAAIVARMPQTHSEAAPTEKVGPARPRDER